MRTSHPVVLEIQEESRQGPSTRRPLYTALRERFGLPVIAYFTSFIYPVSISDEDAQQIEGILQHMDTPEGFILMINSPGGDALAAERIINICRTYSGTREFKALVPGKAKSAATMICFGASEIFMGATSELGPVDPQIILPRPDGTSADMMSAAAILESYDDLFTRAVAESGNLEPYIQQLERYDARYIDEIRVAEKLSESVSVKALKAGMMQGQSESKIRSRIAMFLSRNKTNSHGRPIYRDDAAKCGLKIREFEVRSEEWRDIFALYSRLDNFVSTTVSKVIESELHSLSVRRPS